MLDATSSKKSRSGDWLDSEHKLHAATAAVFRMSRWQKRLLMVIADVLMLAMAVWLGFAIRLGEVWPLMGEGIWLFLLAPVLSLPIFIRLGLYRAVIRYIGSQALHTVARGALYSTLGLMASVPLLHLGGIPRSFFFIYFGLAFLFLGGSRYLVRYWYYFQLHHSSVREPVVIYGAGQSGIQLANALGRGQQFSPVGFLDDNPALQGALIQGLPVRSPSELDELIRQFGIKQVLLALPSAHKSRRNEILRQLEHLPVHVRSIPSASDLVTGKSSVEELHEIELDDLLGRSPTSPDTGLIQSSLQGKRVMITGAGGSIGSELCRQILSHGPSLMVLFDISEVALYQIERELNAICSRPDCPTQLLAQMGSVSDEAALGAAMHGHQVQIVFHAAAYKHVPLVEQNPIEGIRNNSFGTFTAAKVAVQAGVERFVLISTDKAVRPTNVMGASKRLAEMVLQALAAKGGKTVFTMVRFGNVLGSSGSVVPLFRQQIQAGGPVTVTHPDIIRYFMTIPEAAQLVLQAGAIAKGGEIFLLDMGEPVQIVELARRMIRLSGAKIGLGAPQEPGTIAIEFTGLRPGEKLYEELLISGSPRPTGHPQILMGEDGCTSWSDLQVGLDQLNELCKQRNIDAIYEFLPQWVEGCNLTARPRKAT